MSKRSVGKVLDTAEGSDPTRDEAEDMKDAGIYWRLFPEKTPTGSAYPDPDWKRAHREHARTSVAIKLEMDDINMRQALVGRRR